MAVREDLAQAIKRHMEGRFGEAETLYRKVLNVQPLERIALANMGVLANQARKFEEAAGFLKRALAVAPRDAAALCNYGTALAGMGLIDEAIESFRRALEVKPDFPEALYNLGMWLEKAGGADEAAAALQHAIRLRPQAPEFYNVLGGALVRLGKLEEALAAYAKAIELRPDFAQAHNNTGNVLLTRGFLEKALAAYETALAIAPGFTEAVFNKGMALDKMGRQDEAIEAFAEAVAARPDFVEARCNLIKARQAVCDWREAEADETALFAALERAPGKVDPFFLLSQNSTPAQQLTCARAFAKSSEVTVEKVYRHTVTRTDRKLRIGYISGNFHKHPNSYLSVGLFERHDRSRFDVCGYSYGPDDGSDIRKRVEKSFDRFIDIAQASHAEAAARIKADGIDILIDRQGFTARHRMGILAHRPAPIQINYLGYPGTMGADYIDYVIVDPFNVPPDQQAFFSETLAYMPDCYQSTDDRREIAGAVPTRAECGLPEGAFVFCCFNNPNKLRPETFAMWMRLLADVPGSVLWLLAKNEPTKDNLRREAAERGVDPVRLVFAGELPHAEHLARHRLADLFLDTLPYNAHTTASDALWAGLPVLTLAGTTFAGRVAGGILHALEMPELVTGTADDYEALARKLAREPESLAAIREKLAGKRLTAPLFDTARYARNLEAIYLNVWEKRCALG